jgi:hypothetical protein
MRILVFVLFMIVMLFIGKIMTDMNNREIRISLDGVVVVQTFRKDNAEVRVGCLPDGTVRLALIDNRIPSNKTVDLPAKVRCQP